MKLPIANNVKTSRQQFKWTVHSTHTSLEEIEDLLEAENMVLYDNKDLLSGQKFYYRCACIPRDRKRESWCALRYVIYFPSDCNDIFLQCNDLDHNHNELLKGQKRPISKDMLAFIHDLYDKQTFKYTSIIMHIESARDRQNLFKDESNPTTRQLEYCLSKYRAGNSTQKMINLGDLMQWCEGSSNYPDDIDEAFALSYECNAGKSFKCDASFRFCITSPRLLEVMSKADTICIDATYKLNWMGFPLIILGTIDRQKHFHPIIYACSSNETSNDYAFVFQSLKNGIEKYFPSALFKPKRLVADGADAIRNAFYSVFSDSAEVDVMCFAHVLRNIRSRPFASKNNKPLIIDDIKKMQLAQNRNVFDMMAELFVKKWMDLEPNFVNYFQKQWLGVHSNWFEGVADYTPSTNNAVESHNSVIKRKVTFRRRLPLLEFLIAMKTMTCEISQQFAEEKRSLAVQPNISRDTMIRAAEMECNGFLSFKAKTKSSGRTIYILPASDCPEENANYAYYKTLSQKQWKSFDEYINYGYQLFWLVHFNSNEWKMNSSCTCPVFFKNHICKHIVAFALKEKLIECPQTANPMLIAPRKQPGRPRNATKSLQRD